MKRKYCLVIVLMCVIILSGFGNARALAKADIIFTDEEKDFIKKTQTVAPLKMGVIPHLFPISICPPESSEFKGINVEMLDLITEKSGLVFTYIRIPTEAGSPNDFLHTGEVELVSGTIRLDRFTKDPSLILSDRLSDGASVYIAKQDFSPDRPKSKKIASKHGYQAGLDNVAQEFDGYEVLVLDTNYDVVRSVRDGEADMAVINRYTGMYELQKPINSKLVMLPSQLSNVDSCIMGLKTAENKIAISIINKALAAISPGEYNQIQMNFIISNPYKLTFFDVLYQYRYTLLAIMVAIGFLAYMGLRLATSKKEKKLLSKDSLTGAYTEAGFNLEADKIMSKSVRQRFIVDFDVLNFQGYNELHGREEGDALLKNIVNVMKSILSEEDILCRVYADNFRVLGSKPSIDKLVDGIKATDALLKKQAKSVLVVSYGIYHITDIAMPITQMLDFANQAKKSVKYSADKTIGIFDAELHKRSLREIEMFSLFQSAIDRNEFLAYYQPKYDVRTKKIIGAEALVRWLQKDGSILSPFHFIDLFERNGQIRRLDFYMLTQACKFQKKLMDQNKRLVPISVNFSRVHLYSGNLPSLIDDVVEVYGIPKCYIEIEWTESTIMKDNGRAEKIFKALQERGYSISMDDFGSAYSSLNTLCNMPLDIIKLDREFMLSTLNESQGKKDKVLTIVSSVIALAKKLSLRVVAEGVETEDQYLFLKEVGCDYIQGYYFSKPVEEEKFLQLLDKDK